MKNKKITYLLGAAVIMIWGTVLYRVFSYWLQPDNESPVQQASAAKPVYNDFAETPDTVKLLLNYPDPFNKREPAAKDRDTQVVALRPVIKPRMNPMPAMNNNATNWNFIRYSGYIRNQGSNKLIAVVTLNGHEATLQEGETLDRVKLLKNMRDSIRISYNGQTRYITLDRNTP